MISQIEIVSSASLEKWDWRAPSRGIGGSETSHVEMARGLFKRGLPVISYAPVPEDNPPDPTGVLWQDEAFWTPRPDTLVINYRNAELFNHPKPSGAKWWFVAQDVGYPWEQEWLDRVDRYICLCPTHAKWTRDKHPELHTSGRLFISSNGIDSEGIKEAIDGIERNPQRLMFASSPDRGLELILNNWFRIRERAPEAELHVFYGFQNMKRIVELNGGGDWRADFMQRLERLLSQPGVFWHDRVGQREIWQEWAKTNIFFYPTDFPETSMITCMEAQACGAIPVVNNFWAPKYNVLTGYKFDGIPQDSKVVTALMVERVLKLLNEDQDLWWDAPIIIWDDDGDPWNGKDRVELPAKRSQMMIDARERFDWANIVNQWENWIREDSK